MNGEALWLLARYGDVAGVDRALGTDHVGSAAFLKATDVPRVSDELNEVRDGGWIGSACLITLAEHFRMCIVWPAKAWKTATD